MSGKINPLHQAVIEGDEEAVAKLTDHTAWHKERDSLGFTPLELAQLLGRNQCQLLLGGLTPKSVRVQKKGEKCISLLPLKVFEKDFGIAYRPFLTFASYTSLRQIICDCSYLLRFPWLAKENLSWAEQYRQQLTTGANAPTVIQWIDERLEYGLFADSDIPAGTYIGEYAGLVRRLYRSHPEKNGYCFHYPSRLWSWHYYVIDAFLEGNVLRFLNHSDSPNLQPQCAVDRGLLHLIFVASCLIPKGTQLTFDYGDDYWVKRNKVEN